MSLPSAPEGINDGKLVMPSARAHPSVWHRLRARFGDVSAAIWKGAQLTLCQNGVKSYVPEAEGLFAVDFSWERIVQSDFAGQEAHGCRAPHLCCSSGWGTEHRLLSPSAATGQSRDQSLEGVNFIFCVAKLQYLLFLRTQACACPLQVSCPGTAVTGADVCSELQQEKCFTASASEFFQRTWQIRIIIYKITGLGLVNYQREKTEQRTTFPKIAESLLTAVISF